MGDLAHQFPVENPLHGAGVWSIAALVALVLAIAAFVAWSRQGGTRSTSSSAAAAATADRNAAGTRQGTAQTGPRARRGGRDRMMAAAQLRQRRAASGAGTSQGDVIMLDAEDEDDAGSGSEDEEPVGTAAYASRKEARRAERREQREAEVEARQARADKQSAYDARRRQREEERERQEQAQEEAARRAAEEQQRQADAEAAKWMNMIDVQEEGSGQVDEDVEGPDLLEQFVNHIKAQKMVSLEDLAIEFNLRSSDVIDRIRSLEAMGRLTGIMDERGKYIYISLEELQAVAEHIRKRGRISISELARDSNIFISLEPTIGESNAQQDIKFLDEAPSANVVTF